MSYQHNIQQVVNGGAVAVNKSNTYSSAQQSGFQSTISAGATVIPNFSVDVSQMVSLVISCDRDVVLTFNDDGTPDATVNLLADKPLVWSDDGYFTNPLGIVDITSFKATLSAGADATLTIEVNFD